MTTSSDRYILRSTATSPFGRKVRIAIEVLGLADRVTMVPADTLDENDTLRQQNPLGKLPCLLLGDGTPIYGSGVIVEFLQELVGDDTLLPAHGLARYKALTKVTLADGIAEAALLMVYEGRFREPGSYSERWLRHQREKIARALTAVARDLPDPARTDLPAIALACALGYLDWRKPVDWRQDHPRVAEWLAEFSAHEPAYARTRAPDQ